MVTAETLERAIIYATEKHKGVTRKGDGTPYIIHPIRVMMTLFGIKGNSVNIYLLAVAAILHDVVEDCGVTIQEIAELFGYDVAAIVEQLTSDSDKIEAMGKTEYLTQKLLKISSYALVIKLIDRLDNIKDMKTMPETFSSRQIKSTMVILNALEMGRKLTGTHKTLISMIREEMDKYQVLDGHENA